MGGEQNELYCNSLAQMAAAAELSPVCINSDSELEIHFSDVISVAAAELSPELASSNNSSESVMYVSDQQQDTMPVPSHDNPNSEEEETSRGHSDVMSSLLPEQEYCDAMSNTYQVTQPSETCHFTRCEDFHAKESEAFSEKESEECSASNMASNVDIHDECLISEEDKLEPRNDTVAAFWLSPVSVLGIEQSRDHKPPTYKIRGPDQSTPQLIPRARQPRKPPDSKINEDESQIMMTKVQ